MQRIPIITCIVLILFSWAEAGKLEYSFKDSRGIVSTVKQVDEKGETYIWTTSEKGAPPVTVWIDSEAIEETGYQVFVMDMYPLNWTVRYRVGKIKGGGMKQGRWEVEDANGRKTMLEVGTYLFEVSCLIALNWSVKTGKEDRKKSFPLFHIIRKEAEEHLKWLKQYSNEGGK